MSRGHIAKICDCRDPDTGKKLGKGCPKRSQTRHGSWMFVVGVRDHTGKRKQIARQGFPTKTVAQAELERTVGKVRDGVLIDDKLTFSEWLDTWLAGKTSDSGVSGVGKPLRPTTARSYESHIRPELLTGLLACVVSALERPAGRCPQRYRPLLPCGCLRRPKRHTRVTVPASRARRRIR